MTQIAPHPYLEPMRRGFPIAIAHRGGAGLPENAGIENTMAAFAHAVEYGFRYLETDVHLSRDGVLYAFHDASLQRLTGSPSTIGELDSVEIDAVRLNDTEPIARMTELLDTFSQCMFSVDVKSDAAVETMIALARRHLSRLCLASFSGARLARIRAALPGAVTSFAPRSIAKLRLGVCGRTIRSGAYGELVATPVRHRTVPVVTPSFIRRAHTYGIGVHVWTVDDRETMTQLLDMGVDGIFTDRPDILRDVLQQRGRWDGPWGGRASRRRSDPPV